MTPQDQQTNLYDVPQLAAPAPGDDDQPAHYDQQPSTITYNTTQPATIPAAVARLVLNPVGYNG